MTSKHRVFANSNIINYNEYIKNKQGAETLKTIKNNSKNTNITRFKSYEEFIIFSKCYYKYKDLNCCQIQSTENLFNSNISFISQNKKNKIEENECNLLKQVLYPYGYYQSNKVSNMYFPYKINLDNWCLKKKQCEYTFFDNHSYDNHDNDDNHNNHDNYGNHDSNGKNGKNGKNSNNSNHDNHDNHGNNSSNNDKKCKTGLCGNTKQLFI